MKALINSFLQHWWVFCIGYVLRVAVIIYTSSIDQYLPVKYTDIDYFVFTDSSMLVYEGFSPYDRSTYRYTPLLSYILLPNILLTNQFGKHLFALADLAVTFLIALTLYTLSKQGKIPSISADTCVYYSFFYLFNPLAINLSTRGSMDVLSLLLVFIFIYAFETGYMFIAALFYAISIHMRIYPFIFSLAIFSRFVYFTLCENDTPSIAYKTFVQRIKAILSSLPRALCKALPFFIYVAIVNIFLLYIFSIQYGAPFLHESYLFHTTRKDTRHNFSPAFLSVYLNSDLESIQNGAKWDNVSLLSSSTIDNTSHSNNIISYLYNLYQGSDLFFLNNDNNTKTITLLSRILKILSILPQMILLLVLSTTLASAPIAAPVLLLSLSFVAYNAVITAQYFLWWIALVPFVLPYVFYSVSPSTMKTQITSSFSTTLIKTICCGVGWLLSEVMWLLTGAAVEIQGSTDMSWKMMALASSWLFIVHLSLVCAMYIQIARSSPSLSSPKPPANYDYVQIQ